MLTKSWQSPAIGKLPSLQDRSDPCLPCLAMTREQNQNQKHSLLSLSNPSCRDNSASGVHRAIATFISAAPNVAAETA
ncbi:hypothetical protein POX_b02210 [Penicillium oxalicum]|uniref:hypothetical protein n=1 Tax=Penicillium oxalicum TaxID=69781 RepID=UPI0020B713F2|nr:hypothetical protein POX_b02210 [Penicillium oxalicum]KAI2792173.1 hypothetical protein POX_b02210 [Penicillium oxalicum]